MNLTEIWRNDANQIYIYAIVGAGAVLFVFFSCLVSLLRRSNRVLAHFQKLTTGLRTDLGDAPFINPSILSKIDDRMRRDDYLSHSWSEFKETLIVEDTATTKESVLATRSIQEFVVRDKILEERAGLSFFPNVSGLLTSFGLALTFIFIVEGLTKLYTGWSPPHLDRTRNLMIGDVHNGVRKEARWEDSLSSPV